MAGKLLIRIGNWLNTHFPEKVSADQVYAEIAYLKDRCSDLQSHTSAAGLKLLELESLIADRDARFSELVKKVEVLVTENTALKAQAALRTFNSSKIPIPGR